MPQRFCKETPGELRAGIIFAKSLLSLGEAEKAVSFLKKIELYAPDNVEILYTKSLAYLTQNNAAEATSSLEKILTLNPDFSPALVTMSDMLIRAGKN